MIDKQGFTGRKVEYLSIPYKSITAFSVESAGFLDRDAEIKLWISGRGAPIVKTVNRKAPIPLIQKALAVGVSSSHKSKFNFSELF
jgi:hypothetical protein